MEQGTLVLGLEWKEWLTAAINDCVGHKATQKSRDCKTRQNYTLFSGNS